MKRTEQQCKSILFQLGVKYGISPKMISERLLSQVDKDDMAEGRSCLQSLENHVRVWKERGCPNMNR